MRTLEILWASPYVPYDRIGHAGGKSHNYYVKGIASDPRFCVTLISFGQTSGQYFRYPQFRPNLLRRIKELENEGYRPDVIILEWTQVSFFQDKFRKAFPNVPVIVYEIDIAFQAAQRHMNRLGVIRRMLAYCQLKTLERAERNSLFKADSVLVHNQKDRSILLEIGLPQEKLDVIPLFYQEYSERQTSWEQPNLVFWGAMSRPENYASVLRFIEGPWKKIADRNPELKFYVVGGNPPKVLQERASNKIIVTGFVEDPAIYFANASIMIAPLLTGGGLKVKILESMSAGLAIVGNEIAMEGIGALDGIHYLHAESDEEFVETTCRMVNEPEMRRRLGEAGKKLVKENFNFQVGLVHLADHFVRLANKNGPQKKN